LYPMDRMIVAKLQMKMHGNRSSRQNSPISAKGKR
jgi:hypothetical protein